MQTLWYAAVSGSLLGMLFGLVLLRRRSSGVRDSKRAHEAAVEREPPVDVGGTYEFGVTEFTDHHSGERIAVGKVEGFVLFTRGVPESVDEGDVIEATVHSFNEGRTSAAASFDRRV